MKHTLQLLIIAMTLAVSCAETDKRARLEALKQQQSEIKQEIALLEKELEKEGGYTKANPVATTEMNTETFVHKIEVQAKVEGDQNVSVSPSMPGNISMIHVKVGDRVSEGTLLAELDNGVLEKTLGELQSQREFAAVLYEKQKSLWDQKIGTEVQFLQAKNTLVSVDKKLATLREQLEMTRIKAPINGTVDAVDLKIGQAFAPGMPGLRVVNFSKLKVKAEVAEAYIDKIKTGDSVEVYFPDLKQTLSAKITHSGKVIDALNRTFKVEVELKKDDIKLHPNQVAVLRIIDYRNDNSLVLPLDVVQQTPEGSYVYTATGKKVTKTPVKPGKTYNGKVEVTEGINPGDKVVTSGYQDLVDGQTIDQ
jgi:RND family efflux transporter MFP subunit